MDRRQLLAEAEVPVGLVRCLYDSLLRCSCYSHSAPFNTCCAQSVIGSWSGKLLCLPLPCHAGPARPLCCTWQTVLRPDHAHSAYNAHCDQAHHDHAHSTSHTHCDRAHFDQAHSVNHAHFDHAHSASHAHRDHVVSAVRGSLF